jgi:DNA-directed RNA polymerase specialized sigma24 family protein
MDAVLVTQAQRGDEQAFEALVERHYSRLQRAAVGILRDIHVAEDATQNTLVIIWRDLSKLRDPARFEGWSYRLLVRTCYAEAKRVPLTISEDDMLLTMESTTSDAYAATVQPLQLRGLGEDGPLRRQRIAEDEAVWSLSSFVATTGRQRH